MEIEREEIERSDARASADWESVFSEYGEQIKAEQARERNQDYFDSFQARRTRLWTGK